LRSDEDTLRAAYEAFNARDLESALALMHPEVDWPNAWEGGRVTGRDAKTSEIQSDTHVLHRWRLERGLVVRMDVLDIPASD